MRKTPTFEEKNRWLESEKIEEKILKIIDNSDLSYWETIGMLQHMILEIHEIVTQDVDKFRMFDNDRHEN